MLIPVILAGGSGTRLWPLSTPDKPKQFLRLVSDRSLFQETLSRLEGLPGLGDPIIVCNEAHRELVAGQLDEVGIRARAVLLEPEGRNTAPAIGVVASLAAGGNNAADDILLVLPADHVIADAAAFRQAVARAVAGARAGRLVTFGIVPTHPETGFGYIEQGPAEGDWHAVLRFVEKPDRERAEGYLRTGRHLWNGGMFVFGARELLTELGRRAPAIQAACTNSAAAIRVEEGVARLGAEFLASPSESIDYAVMEKTDRAAVVRLDAGWSDVGSWAALYDVLAKDAQANVLRGDVASLDSHRNLVIADSRRVALLGVENVVVIDAGDTLLVLAKDRSQDVKRLQQRE
jgi:mannose-1-phosphate guanylyltransferase/mannose-6-phosphate isomerase